MTCERKGKKKRRMKYVLNTTRRCLYLVYLSDREEPQICMEVGVCLVHMAEQMRKRQIGVKKKLIGQGVPVRSTCFSTTLVEMNKPCSWLISPSVEPIIPYMGVCMHIYVHEYAFSYTCTSKVYKIIFMPFCVPLTKSAYLYVLL